MLIKTSVITANTADIGGGIHTGNKSNTDITGSTIFDNTAGSGGGIRNGGFMEITMSTINDNTSASFITGGGIRNLSLINISNTTISGNVSGISNLGDVNMNNVTVASNTSLGIANADDLGAVLNLKNSIVADTSGPSGVRSDCIGTLTSEGYNLIETVSSPGADCIIAGDTTGNIIGVDPMLLPLDDYGGLTQTHALDANSPAVDAGNPATPGSGGDACEIVDQRGVERNCDCGAFELADGEDPMPDEGGDDIAAGSSSSGCSMTTGIIKPITIAFNIIILLIPVFVVGLRSLRKRKISD